MFSWFGKSDFIVA